VDPAAVQILKHLTDYLVSLKKFSLLTENTLEDLLESGHRVDFNISASGIVSRPNKLWAESRGDRVDQVPKLTFRFSDLMILSYTAIKLSAQPPRNSQQSYLKPVLHAPQIYDT
jgi:hypothetical protein